MISPYLPMLFMGEEWSEPNPFLYFVSHTDNDLAEAVRKGRKEEFAAFHIEGEAPDPVAEKTFSQSKLQWNLLERGQHKLMLDYYKELIQLRKVNPALKELNRKNLEVITYKEQNTLLVKRWNEKEKLVCFLNFSQEPQSISYNQQSYNQQLCKKIFDSADAKWNGFPTEPNQVKNEAITVQSESIVIYQTHH
jgi:maltooligosyltrehalose trehalohydrolase